MRSRCLAALLVSTTLAAQQPKGIQGQAAPPLGVKRWSQLPKGLHSYEPSAQRGAVQVLFFFQAHCPFSRKQGIRLLRALVEHFAGRKQVRFAAVQTVFEGRDHNTPKAGRELLAAQGLKIPLGYQTAAPDQAIPVMARYRSPGTPWLILIDRQGVVRHNSHALKMSAKQAIGMVALLDAQREILGSPLGALQGVQQGRQPVDLSKQRFTLIRWWTNTCPHCAASLPALEKLRREVKGFEVLAMYHPKPVRRVGLDRVAVEAARLGFQGPVAQDPRWQMFWQLRARGLPGRATSVSVLVDRQGIIRWVHPGPRIHPDPDGRHPAAARAYAELRKLVSPK